MRRLFYFLAWLLLIAVLLFFGGHSTGTVTIFWPPYRADLSLNLALVLLATLLVVAAIVLHGLFGGLAHLWRGWRERRLTGQLK